MLPRTLLTALVVSVLSVASGFAHEFWIEPEKYQVQSGAELIANFRNGQNFTGGAHAFFPKRSLRFDTVHNDQTTAVDARMGDVPALETLAPEDGLLSIVHETAPATVRYTDWEKFQAFAKHKNFPGIHARQLARNLPESDFSESYTRHAKALVGVGMAIGADQRTGMETEFVALSNPYTDDPSGGFVVALYYQDAPRTNAQVEVFDRHPDGRVTVTMERTDESGQAIIPIQSGHEYLLDAVVLREPLRDDDDDVAWETLWAALTFSVP